MERKNIEFEEKYGILFEEYHHTTSRFNKYFMRSIPKLLLYLKSMIRAVEANSQNWTWVSKKWTFL